jgi:hypothetical protein
MARKVVAELATSLFHFMQKINHAKFIKYNHTKCILQSTIMQQSTVASQRIGERINKKSSNNMG